MYQVEVLMMDGKWQRCQRLMVVENNRYVHPEFTTRKDALEAASTLPSDWPLRVTEIGVRYYGYL